MGRGFASIRSIFSGIGKHLTATPGAVPVGLGTRLPNQKEEIPYPQVDLARLSNPVPEIVAAPEYQAADAFFLQDPAAKRSLISARGQAIIYALIRNQRPAHVVEIGTYHGGTTETMARALHANGGGLVHTVSPFDPEAFTSIYLRWPSGLRRLVKFYPVDSMTFYMDIERQNFRPDFVFVDGNHDYEFALFDILCAARRLKPGGFLIANNACQAGPYFAVRDFLASHPDWIDCVAIEPQTRDRTRAFDPARGHLPGTDFIILRAPICYRLFDDRPWTLGEVVWPEHQVRGLKVLLDGRQCNGRLYAQYILRGFGDGLPPGQITGTAWSVVEGDMREINVSLTSPRTLDSHYDRCALEIWLIWMGQGPLCIEGGPVPY
jgi:predicted O-methyltransferase YrrM